jgi:hypothetical protein
MQYYIVFRDTPHKLLKRILKKGFQHCFVLVNDGYGWFRLDPRNDFLKPDLLPYAADEDVTKIFPDFTKIQYIVDHKDSQLLHIVPSLLNCVTITKYIIGLRGVRSFFIWTPWQLYKYVKNVKRIC